MNDTNKNIAYTSLILTSLTIFITSTAILQSAYYFSRTVFLAFICIGILCTIYFINDKFKSNFKSILFVFLTLSLIPYLQKFHIFEFLPFFFIFSIIYFLKNNLKIILRSLPLGIVGMVTILYRFFEINLLPLSAYNNLRNGIYSQDMLYHSAISAMIKNYQAVSSGINGTEEIPYHFISHAIISGISLISSSGVFETYDYSIMMIFSPLLIFSLSMIAVNIKKDLSIYTAWSVISLILIIYPFIFKDYGGWNQFFTSPSYLISLTLFLFSVYALTKSDNSNSNLIFYSIAGIFLSLIKISVGYIYIILWVIKFYLNINKEKKELVLIIFTIFVIYYFQSFFIKSQGSHLSIEPLSFIKEYVYLGGYFDIEVYSYKNKIIFLIEHFYLVFKFIIFHFILSIIALLSIKYYCNDLYLKKIYSLFIISTSLIGLIVCLFIKIPGGSAYYFSNISFILSIPFIFLFFNKNLFFVFISLLIFLFFLFLSIFEIYKFVEIKKSQTNRNIHHLNIVDKLDLIRRNSDYDFLKLSSKINLEQYRCSPFLFPAISERPWVNIHSSFKDCKYEFYGYEILGITNSLSVPNEIKRTNAKPIRIQEIDLNQ